MIIAVAMTSCEKFDEGTITKPETQPQIRKSLTTRSYAEALALAESSIALVDRGTTRAITPRRIAGRGQCVTAPSKTRSGETDTLMYVFNFADNAGFSAIAANRAIEQPILAVTENGNYTYGEPTGVENFDFYMNEMVNTLALIPLPDSVSLAVRTDTIRGMSLIREPMLTVSWNQHGAFGSYFQNGICGCVTTAVAQILSFHEQPSSITPCYASTIPHAGQNMSLDWSMIKNYPNSNNTLAQYFHYKISALCRDIGQRVGADDSSPGITNAYSARVPSCLSAYGYTTNNIQIVAGNESYLRLELSSGFPVYIDGRVQNDYQNGHAWVADGVNYQKITYHDYTWDVDTEEYVLIGTRDASINLIHYNWGWGPTYNGEYALIDEVAEGGYTFERLYMIGNIRFE